MSPADVVAGDQRLQRGEQAEGPVPRVRRVLLRGQRHALPRRGPDVAIGALEVQQRGTGVHLVVGPDQHLADPAGERCAHYPAGVRSDSVRDPVDLHQVRTGG
jgi:hypothetical protein